MIKQKWHSILADHKRPAALPLSIIDLCFNDVKYGARESDVTRSFIGFAKLMANETSGNIRLSVLDVIMRKWCLESIDISRKPKTQTYFCCASFICSYSRRPLALFHNTKHPVLDVSIDITKGKLLTCGSDRIVKVQNIARCLKYIGCEH